MSFQRNCLCALLIGFLGIAIFAACTDPPAKSEPTEKPAAKPATASKTAPATDVESLLKQAETLIEAKKYTDAIKVATKAIELAPKDPRGYKLRGKAEYWNAKGTGINRGVSASVSIEVNSKTSTIRQSAIQLRKFRSPALRDLQLATRLGADDIETRVLVAGCHLFQHKHKEALHQFDAILQRHPKNVDALLGRSKCRLFLGDLEAALADIDQAIAIDSTRVEFLEDRSAINFLRKDYLAMEHDMNRALRLDDRNDYFFQLRGLARAFLGQLYGSLADFQEAIRLNPDCFASRLGLSGIYVRKRESAKSLPHLSRAIRCAASPSDRLVALKLRFQVYLELGQLDKALVDANLRIKLSKSTPDRIEAYTSRDRIYRDMQNTVLARIDIATIQDLRRLAGLEARHQESPKNPRFLLELAEYHAEKNEDKKAIEFYSKAISINSKLHTAFKGRATVFLRLKQFDKAIADCNAVIRLNPQEIDIYLLRGQAYLQKKNYDAAIADFTKGRAFGADFASAYLGRAKAHQAAGRKKAAAEDFQRAYAMDPLLRKSAKSKLATSKPGG